MKNKNYKISELELKAFVAVNNLRDEYMPLEFFRKKMKEMARILRDEAKKASRG